MSTRDETLQPRRGWSVSVAEDHVSAKRADFRRFGSHARWTAMVRRSVTEGIRTCV
jgi:hypothetical protein